MRLKNIAFRRKQSWGPRLAGWGVAWTLLGCGSGSDIYEPADDEWLPLKNEAQVRHFQLEATDEALEPGQVVEILGLDVAMAPDNRFATVWGAAVGLKESNLAAQRANIRMQLFDAEGVADGGQRGVATAPGVFNLEPSLSMNARGESYIVWTQSTERVQEWWGYPSLAGRRFGADGAPLGPETVLVKPAGAFIVNYRFNVALDGSMLLSWIDDQPNRDAEAQTHQWNADGTLRWPSSPVKDGSVGLGALALDGSSVVAGGIWAKNDWGGEPDGARTQLRWFDRNGIRGKVTYFQDQLPSSVLFGRDGTLFLAAYRADSWDSWKWGQAEAYLVRIDRSGMVLGQTRIGALGPGGLDNYNAMDFGVVLAQGPDGRLVAIWQSSSPQTPGIRALYLSEEGSRIGTELRVDEHRPDVVYASENGRPFQPEVAMGSGGRFVVVHRILLNDAARTHAIQGAIVQP